MEKKSYFVIFTVFLAVLFIFGCTGVQQGRTEPPVSAEFVATGTQGLELNFVSDQPPAKVYTQGPLTFLVEVRNRGTYTVPSASLYLTGFDPSLLVGLPVNYQVQDLEGKSQFNPDGGYTTAEFSTSNVILPASMPNYNPTFLLTACYPYQTIATPLVCIDPNPLDTTTDKACTVQKVYGAGSQGAPVAVQSIEADARPTGMFFRIHIGNVGGGTVFTQDNMGACPGGLQYSDLNMIRFEADISGSPLDCEPKDGKIRIVNNQATVFCKFMNIGTTPAYQTPLNVRLSYGYKNSVSKIVEIENLNFAR